MFWTIILLGIAFVVGLVIYKKYSSDKTISSITNTAESIVDGAVKEVTKLTTKTPPTSGA